MHDKPTVTTHQVVLDTLADEVRTLTAENAKLRYLLSWASNTIADLTGGGQHLVIMQEIDSWLTDNAD